MALTARPFPRTHTAVAGPPPPLHIRSAAGPGIQAGTAARVAGATSPAPAGRPGADLTPMLQPAKPVIELDPSNRTTWPSPDAVQFS